MQNNRNRRLRLNPVSEVETIREIMYDYSENMNYYSSNIRRMMDYLQYVNENREHNHETNPQRQTQRERQRHTQINNNYEQSRRRSNILPSLFTNTLQSGFNNFRDNLQNIFDDVIVRPTNLQIQNAVETLIYDPSGQYPVTLENTVITSLETTHCPITMEEICPGHRLSRIRHCNHIFSRDALNNWFSVNVRCPICRYDIRETPIQIFNNPTSTPPADTTQSTQQSPIIQPTQPVTNIEDILDNELERFNFDDDIDFVPLPLDISATTTTTNTNINTTTNQNTNNNWRNISNTLRTFIQQELRNNPTTAELMYTFDIPFVDISGSFY